MSLIHRTTVRELPQANAGPFIERWHYSHLTPTGKNIFLGWYVNPLEESLPLDADNLFGESLYAVANYGIGVNPYQAQFLNREHDANIQDGGLLELKRLCRVEPKVDRMPLTHFLSRCHKLLKRRGYTTVVSFSDPAHGHTGGIYRASNFKHVGQSNAEMHVLDSEGVVRHRRYAFRYSRRHHITIGQARDLLNLTPVKTEPKDRWLLTL